MTEEEKRLKEEAENNIKKLAADKAEEIAKKYFDDFVAGKYASPEELKQAKEDLKKDLADMQAKMKKMEQIENNPPKKKHFNEFLREAIEKNADAISGFRPKSSELRISLKDGENEPDIMTIGTHTEDFDPFIQDVRPGLVYSPYPRIWLSDILPSATSTGNSIVYPVEDGQIGEVDVWDGTKQSNGNGGEFLDKPELDWKLSSKTVPFIWLAGTVTVQREMLDDINWLTSYLQHKLLTSLKLAENDFILNGVSGTIDGIFADATSYDGTEYERLLEQIIDAAYGQIVDETDGYYNPTTVLINARDAVNIWLNKAKGSGEFDHPANTTIAQGGRLNIVGLETVTIPKTFLEKGKFLTFDKNAMMLFRRLNPEIRMFEDAELARKNQVMFRIEERITQAIFCKDAFVKRTLIP